MLRGSDAEQLAALERTARPRAPSPSRPSAGSLPLPGGERVKARRAKPSRAKLTKAEEALEALEERQSKQLREIEEQQRQLERKRSELKRRHAGELDKAKERVATEKEQYEQAVGSWAGGE